MIGEILKAFFLIFIAEMGDKTQILAMAFATKFPVRKVLTGVFIGVFLNHGLGVLAGKYISDFIPTTTIQIVAGFAFLAFAFWTLKSEDDEDENEEQKYKFGPVLTVALAFFIGELGDKTQLTAITLATNTPYLLAILMGSVLGMIMTCLIGILLGKKLGDKVPEFIIKIAASFVFMGFGGIKLYQNLPQKYLNFQNSFIFIAIIASIFLVMLKSMIESRRKGVTSRFKQKSKELFDFYNQAKVEIEKVCLGEGKCGKCKGEECIVGYTKILINSALKEGILPKQKVFAYSQENINKPYEKEQIINILKTTLKLIKSDNNIAQNQNVNQIRKNLEKMLLGRSIEKINDWESYSDYLYDIDELAAKKILKCS